MVVNRHVAVAGTGWANRARAVHHFIDHHHTGRGRHSAWSICALDTLVKRQKFDAWISG